MQLQSSKTFVWTWWISCTILLKNIRKLLTNKFNYFYSCDGEYLDIKITIDEYVYLVKI